MQNYHQPLLPNHTYHVFSRAVGAEKTFKCDENYDFFLQKLTLHVLPVCDIFCYALLPNHFHLLIRIKDDDVIEEHFKTVKKVAFDSLVHSLTDFIMERFSNFLNSYTKAFNKVYKRKGSLFMDYLKRSKAEDDADFAAFVWYIHKNAVHHGFTKKVGQWKFDSYNSILSDAPSKLLRAELLDFFGGKEAFIKFHQQEISFKRDFLDFL